MTEMTEMKQVSLPLGTPPVWDKQRVQDLLEKNDKALVRALMVVYGNQTEAEQASEVTLEHNQKGFSSYDAILLTSIAKYNSRYGVLSPKQVEITRQRMKKYWKQLLMKIEASGQLVQYK